MERERPILGGKGKVSDGDRSFDKAFWETATPEEKIQAESRFSLTFPLSDYFQDRERNLELETLTVEETPMGDLWRWKRDGGASPILSPPASPEGSEIRRKIAEECDRGLGLVS